MSRWLPRPGLSLVLVLLWLALNNTLATGHVVLAAGIGVVLPLLAQPMLGRRMPGGTRRPLRHLRLGLGLALRLLTDIAVANLAVARRILFAREADLSPALVTIELRLDSPGAVATLAGIVTLTPGTLSADIVEADDAGPAGRYRLLVHALDAPAPDALAAEIRTRYEDPLLEMLK